MVIFSSPDTVDDDDDEDEDVEVAEDSDVPDESDPVELKLWNYHNR